ncbi:MAG: hypothetical protein C0501_17465 [Isosphaera sp.]|nr:hypothetical protein [Isosphaera sp.]
MSLPPDREGGKAGGRRPDPGHGPPRPRGIVLRIPESPRSPTGRPGDLVLDHGRHRGDALRDLPPFYVEWMAREHSSDFWRAAARAWLDEGDHEQDEDAAAEPSPESAAVRFPLIVWKFEEHFGRVYCMNPAALEVVGECAAFLRSECEAVTNKKFPADGQIGGAA